LAKTKSEANWARENYKSAMEKIQSTKEKFMRRKLIKSLASIEDSWASEVLLDSLEERTEEIRDIIVRELGMRKNLNLELVCRKLSHPLWSVKSSALRILGLQKNPAVLTYIEEMLAEPNAEVRRVLAHTLGDIGGQQALALLLKLAKDKNQFVRASAEKAIQQASKLRIT